MALVFSSVLCYNEHNTKITNEDLHYVLYYLKSGF